MYIDLNVGQSKKGPDVHDQSLEINFEIYRCDLFHYPDKCCETPGRKFVTVCHLAMK